MDLVFFLWFFGSLNDINVLQSFHFFSRLASEDALPCNCAINGHTMDYYLAH
jgi:hypothetical protein